MTIQDAARELQSSSYDVGGQPLKLEPYLQWRLKTIADNYAEDASNIDVLTRKLKEAKDRGENFQTAFDSALEDIQFSNVARASLGITMALYASAGAVLEAGQMADILDAVKSGCTHFKEKAEGFIGQIPDVKKMLDTAATSDNNIADLKLLREMALFIQKQSTDNAMADKADTSLTANDKKFEEVVSVLLKEVSPEMALPKRIVPFADKYKQRVATPEPDDKAAREIAKDILGGKVIMGGEEVPAVTFLESMLANSIGKANEDIMELTQYLRGKGPKPVGMDDEFFQLATQSMAEALGISVGQVQAMDEKTFLQKFKSVIMGVTRDTNALVNEIGGLLKTIANSEPSSVIPEEVRKQIYQAAVDIISVDLPEKNTSQELVREKFMALHNALNPSHSIGM